MPNLKEAIGVITGYQELLNCTSEEATVVVAQKLYDHWVTRNIYPITWQGIKEKLDKELQEIKHSMTSTNKTGKSWLQAHKQVEEKPNKLFDIFCQSQGKILKSSMEFQCLMRITDFLS